MSLKKRIYDIAPKKGIVNRTALTLTNQSHLLALLSTKLLSYVPCNKP